ncbi:hypothetical protein J4D99_14930 [Siccationidurans ginsengisoli]|uniref:hypothetical protein n=1 Tax=Hymenobacter TaxID=89966 RepID=UPI001AADDAAC|nr:MULTISPECIES: hypothetical protein [unclassified Hymenobacter]MBO2032689.1 hypothetical protein [Hymenobacter sp. BT559]
MRNPFRKPRSPGQWLLGSVCWTLLCLFPSLLIYFLLVGIFGKSGNASDITYMLLGCISFWSMHLLIWRRAVYASPSWLKSNTASSVIFKLAGATWLFLLIIFQLFICVIFIVFTEIVASAYWKEKIIW